VRRFNRGETGTEEVGVVNFVCWLDFGVGVTFLIATKARRTKTETREESRGISIKIR
jgi:hypothetical protein